MGDYYSLHITIAFIINYYCPRAVLGYIYCLNCFNITVLLTLKLSLKHPFDFNTLSYTEKVRIRQHLLDIFIKINSNHVIFKCFCNANFKVLSLIR